jgi:hypothetical protein
LDFRDHDAFKLDFRHGDHDHDAWAVKSVKLLPLDCSVAGARLCMLACNQRRAEKFVVGRSHVIQLCYPNLPG